MQEHPDFNKENLNNDVDILNLREKLQVSSTIGSIEHPDWFNERWYLVKNPMSCILLLSMTNVHKRIKNILDQEK